MAVSASLWSAPDAIATILSTELNALAAGSVAVSSGSFDNTTIRRQYATLELNVTFGSAPTAGDSVTVYLVPSADTTNFGDTTDPINGPLIAAVFQVRATTGAQRVNANCVIPGPFKFKVALKNNSAQPFPATSSTLKIVTFDNEQQ